MQVLIEFEKQPLLFTDPLSVISCHEIDEVPVAFEKMEEALKSGHYLAGFVSYEAGYSFEECLVRERRYDFPLVCVGVYEKSRKVEAKVKVEDKVKAKVKVEGLNISKAEYFSDIDQIRDHIGRGDVYQITYCIKFKFDFQGDSFALYRTLKKEQPVPYPAYIRTDDYHILSLSPEMFIKKKKENVVTKPMKGTWPRGGSFWEDLWAKRRLHKDPKNRAENIMICDLLRNDLGRIGKSVRAPKLFEVARYKTLCQMTSTVTGKVNRDIPLHKLFKAIHPSGSVTGAPKIRAMQIIREIEREPRKIYTGAIGYITPNKDLFFNVPIRTLLMEKGEGGGAGIGGGVGCGEMGVGGGIVWDSTPESEFAEGMLKAKFLFDSASPF